MTGLRGDFSDGALRPVFAKPRIKTLSEIIKRRVLLHPKRLSISSTSITSSSNPTMASEAGAKSTIEIDVYSDIACPFCYVGSKRLESAKKALPGDVSLSITWHAFLLDSNFHHQYPLGRNIDEYIVEKFGQHGPELMKGRVVASGKSDGAFFGNWIWRPNTLPGHRFIALAAKHGKSHEANLMLFRRGYEEGQNVSEPEVLEEIGRELGLPDVENWLTSGSGMDEVLADNAQATREGITGVPAIFVRSGDSPVYAIRGAEPVSVFVSTFERALAAAGGQR